MFANFVAKVLYCLKKNKKLCVFLDSTMFFVNFLAKSAVLSQKNQSFFAKMLYCTKKTKKINLFRSWDLEAQFACQSDCFFWDSTVFLLMFLQMCCTVPKKQSFIAKVLYCPQKKPIFSSLVALFLVFFWDSTAFLQKKIGFFWDSTVFLLIFLQKCCTVPKKNNLFLQKCCTVPKKPKKTIFSSLVALRGPRT